MTDYGQSLSNLRRHLRTARLALLSDAAFQAALEAEREREWQETRDAQARIVRAFIDYENGDEPATVRRLDQSVLILREPGRCSAGRFGSVHLRC